LIGSVISNLNKNLNLVINGISIRGGSSEESHRLSEQFFAPPALVSPQVHGGEKNSERYDKGNECLRMILLHRL